MVGTRVARELARQSVEIVVVAEGKSVDEWKNAGFNEAIVAEGPLDIKASWDISPKDVFFSVKPDVLVCGLSSPIRSEAWFAAGAKNPECSGGLPLVYLDDNWGAIHRCQTPADLVLTIDTLGEKLVHQHELYRNHREDQVRIIGDLSASAASEPIPQGTIDAFNKAKGDAEYAFVLCSQKWPESDDIIDTALESCAFSLKAGAKLVVIPRWHPGAKQEDRARWTEKVLAFVDAHPNAVSILGDSFSTDHLAALADGTFAATGSALRAAAYAGKIPICIWTPRLGQKLKAESGMEHHPLYIHGNAFGFEKPTHVTLQMMEKGEYVRNMQQELLQPIPFDAAKAAEAIMALVPK
jgi:hypothetical protein